MISIDGKPMIATHWDGYPENLGEQLMELKKKDIPSILKVAKEHSINFTTRPLMKVSEKIMRNKLKGKSGYQWVFEKGQKFVTDMRYYDDFAEYQYDIDSKTGKIKFRKIHGSWKSPDKKTGRWTNMNEKWKAKQLAKIL